MQKAEWLNQLRNPRNPYDRDITALRCAVIYLLEKETVKSVEPEVVESSEVVEEQVKRGRKKKEVL